MRSAEIKTIEKFFTAMADVTRLRLLNLIEADSVSVKTLTEIIGVSQPKISRHLAYLRKAGLVKTTRSGKQIFYAINNKMSDELTGILGILLSEISENRSLKKDRVKLEKIGDSNIRSFGRQITETPTVDNEHLLESSLEENVEVFNDQVFDEVEIFHEDNGDTEEIQVVRNYRPYNDLDDFLL